MEESGTLNLGEVHPLAHDAMEWLKEFQMRDIGKWMMIREAIASTALSGNRAAEIMSGTLDRLDKGEPVSDRYLFGLCWFLIRNYPTKK